MVALGECMRTLLAGLFVLLSLVPALGAAPYEAQTVKAAQEALTRLGFEVGTADGVWGSKTRKALNELREQNGLPPADSLTGSSLALIHRLSPGATTLPHPGTVVIDAVARRAYLTSPNRSIARSQWCPAEVDDVQPVSELLEHEPIAIIDTAANPDVNYIAHGDDWYTPIMQSMLGAYDMCLAGDDKSCQDITGLMTKWAAADALKPGAKRNNRRWDDISWIGNSLLRNFIFAYADARKLTPVDPVDEATILDWLKRRIDEYHYNIPSGNEGEVSYTEAGNHALANMMSGMAFGSLVGDRSMMEDAFASWRVAMGYMRDDGSLPTETRRGARALQYSNFHLAQMISVAEVAAAQDIDLYGEFPAEKSFPKMVEYLLDAYENFDKVTVYSEYNEGSPGDYHIPYIIQMHFGWIPTYFAHYGDDANIDRMRTATIDGRICSQEAMDENKLSGGERICDGNQGEPVPFLTVLTKGGGTIGESANYFMGYPAQCAQGTTLTWPMIP